MMPSASWRIKTDTSSYLWNQPLSKQFEGAVVSLPSQDFRPPDPFPWPYYQRDSRIEIQTTDINATLNRLIEDKVSLEHLNVHSRTLEDLFLELTGRKLRA